MFCEETILQEIDDKNFTRDSVAITYAFCIDSTENPDFAKINRAIVKRWSLSALEYIKNEAWKLRVGKSKIKMENKNG